MSKSVALNRKIEAYPKPVHYKLLLAEADLTGSSRSRIVTEAIEQYYDRMPEDEKRKLLVHLK